MGFTVSLLFFYFLSPVLNSAILHIISLFYSVDQQSVILPNARVYIIDECNGYFIYSLLTGFFIFMKTEFYKTVIAVFVMFIVNVLRILLLINIIKDQPENFHFYHDIVGRAIMIFSFFAILYIFKKTKTV